MLQVLVWVVPFYKRLKSLHVWKGEDLFVVPSYNHHLTSSCKKGESRVENQFHLTAAVSHRKLKQNRVRFK